MKDSAHKDETAPAVDGFQNAIDAARFLDSLTPFTLGVCRDRDVESDGRRTQTPSFHSARFATHLSPPASRRHFPLHEMRDLAAAFSLASEKGFQMARDRPIQQRVFRIPLSIVVFVFRSGSNTRMIGSRHGRREANRTPTGQFYELTEDTDVSEEIREVM